MKTLAWIPALVISAAFHGFLLVGALPVLVGLYVQRTGHSVSQEGTNVVLAFVIGWCVLVSIWTAMVANVLSKPSNKWGGIRGLRLFGIVAGLTLALDLVNSPCFFTCPPTALIIPILSFVGLYNTSMPPPPEQGDPMAHG